MKRQIAASGIFLLFLLSGGVWVSVVRLFPDGIPRAVAIFVIGVVFVGVFIWLLITRVRRILAGTERLRTDLLVVALDVTLLILAFASMYQKLGIMDNTTSNGPVIYSFTTSVYYSVVTFTTLGYGDFYPTPSARSLAGLQALTGYIILGLLASTAVNIISPHTEAGRREQEEQREEGRKEEQQEQDRERERDQHRHDGDRQRATR